MKAFVGLCGPLDGGLLAFWGLRPLHSSCFSYQEHNTKGAFMPFIINVGVSRKASKDYQSTGYSLNLTAELDSGLLADSNRLQNEIERIYSQATIALNRQVEGSVGQQKPTTNNPASVTVTVGSLDSLQNQSINRHQHHATTRPSVVLRVPPMSSVENPVVETFTNNFNSNGAHGGALRSATESQLRALRAICKRSQFDLDVEAHEEFGLIAAQLDVRQASQLIDLLKNRQTESPAERGRFRS